jgi:hypothetical protein
MSLIQCISALFTLHSDKDQKQAIDDGGINPKCTRLKASSLVKTQVQENGSEKYEN